MYLRLSSSVLLAAVLWMPWVAAALPTDAHQPIHIEADTVDIDDPSGMSVYEGNVRFTQGSISLDADRVVIYSRDRKQVDRIVAVGAPARYRQLVDRREQEMRAEAESIEYFANEERVVLEGEARLWQGVNEFSGERIEYSTEEEAVRATGAENGSERVRVTIHPPAEVTPEEPAPEASPEP